MNIGNVLEWWNVWEARKGEIVEFAGVKTTFKISQYNLQCVGA
jgi:hypothetical protein